MKPKKIEYKVVVAENEGYVRPQINYDKIEKGINNYGQEGWILANSVTINYSEGMTKDIIFIFKKYIDE